MIRNNKLLKDIVLKGITLRRFTETVGGIETTKRIIFYDEKYYQLEQIFGAITSCIEIEAD